MKWDRRSSGGALLGWTPLGTDNKGGQEILPRVPQEKVTAELWA